MNQTDLTLERMSEPAFFVSEDLVRDTSPSARYFLPELRLGEPVPSYLDITEPHGEFTRGTLEYCYHRIDGEGGATVLFWPKIQQSLTGWQLEGVIREMRELLSSMMLSRKEAGGSFRRSFCQMFRLVDHMDFLYKASRNGAIPFRPVTMDLAGLLRRSFQEVYPLLREAGVEAVLDSCPSLLIPGDELLLNQMFFGLLSNGAKAAQQGDGQLFIRLRSLGNAAMLNFSNMDSVGAEERMLSLVEDRCVDDTPLPGDGAGMGYAIIKHIAHLHGGTVLHVREEENLVISASLPTGPLDTWLGVCGPRIETGGGFPLAAVELSDVLPSSLYELEDFLD